MNMTTFPSNAVLVWAAGNEPAEFALFGSPDDRDNVAFVPSGVALPDWAMSGGSFGCCAVDQFPVAGGTVLVGFHA